MPNKSEIMPVLYSLPVIETLNLPTRAEVLPKIESGELEYLDFRARVYTNGLNRNHYRFRPEDLTAFALSFEGQPFLRDHETEEIEAREGTILSSMFDGSSFVQDIRLTTRRGMLDFVEGRIDRFSIGWFYDDCICSICQSSFFSSSCVHWPGAKYQTLDGEKSCELIFVNPRGKETSAVNVPAVEGTGIVSQLSEIKRQYLGHENAELQQLKSNLENRQEPVIESASELSAQARGSQQRWRMVEIAKSSLSNYGENIMKIREILKQRADFVAQAAAITELADSENRDLTNEERATFNSILGADGSVPKLDEQIRTIQAERAALEEAQSAQFTAALAEKPQANAPEFKSMKRAEFEALDALAQAAFVKAGNRIED